jgi:SAM-dependent methyltransferase
LISVVTQAAALRQPRRREARGRLERFAVDLGGAHVLDVGASTGGFTDCALQAGAASVVCVDVGRAQLHARLRADPRVTNLEKLNARNLAASDLPRAEFDAVVMDLSFISLKAVLPAVWPLLRPGGVARRPREAPVRGRQGRGRQGPGRHPRPTPCGRPRSPACGTSPWRLAGALLVGLDGLPDRGRGRKPGIPVVPPAADPRQNGPRGRMKPIRSLAFVVNAEKPGAVELAARACRGGAAKGVR